MTRTILYSVSALLFITGCITVNVPLGGGETASASQWTMNWDAPENMRTPVTSSAIRVRDLEASGSYQLSGMVVRHSDGTIMESSDNRWAARPGAMLSEMLARDLMAEGSFPAVFRTAATVNNLLTVEGYVREFGATQVDSATWVAVFDVDVTLLGDRGSTVIMQRNYRYERLMPAPGFSEMVEQMERLSSRWSEEVREDIRNSI